jgi:hypothetical protein
MGYLTQIIVYVLAVMGILFKSTKTDSDGRPIYWKHNIPQFTHTGKVVLVLVTLSSVVAIVSTHSKSVKDEKDREEAEAKQRKTEIQLNNVEELNKALKEILSNVERQGRFISEEQERQFKSVLTEQEQTGESIAKNIETSAGLLQHRLDNSIDLLHQSTGEIDRAVNPLADVLISFEVTPPREHPLISKYQQRLEEGLNGWDPIHPPVGISIGRRVHNGEVLDISITERSTLYPNRLNDGLASDFLNSVGIRIEFYMRPVDADRFKLGFGRNPDLAMIVTSNTSFDRNGIQRAFLRYDLKEHRLFVVANNEYSDPNRWEGSGKITSIPDLLKSEMVVRLIDTRSSSNDQETQALKNLNFDITNVSLKMSGGREFQFVRKMFTRDKDYNDRYFYVCNFSANRRQYEK